LIDAATSYTPDSTVPVEVAGALVVHGHASATEVFAVGV
jgi:hypothetical protein